MSWIFEADIVSFFDSLDRRKLKEMLEIRVADGSLLRLIGKCLHVGVLEGVELSTSETGTAHLGEHPKAAIHAHLKTGQRARRRPGH